MRLAQLGDLHALETLLFSIDSRIRAYVRSLVSRDSADDVLQDVAFTVYKEIRYLREPAAFRSWIYRIATKIAFRYLKQQREWDAFERDAVVLESIPAPDKPTAWEQDASFLERIRFVSPSSRAVLLLHYQQDLDLPHVAAILNIPLGTAKSRLAYGVATLRKQTQESQYASRK